jgi:ABC-type methionine transport system ATPase subunit
MDDNELLNNVLKMTSNLDTAESKKIAILLCNHEKKSVRQLCNKILNGEPINIEDRIAITL